MITYNHEKYLSHALDSILMQKVNFEFEIVVGEDCSTDNTRRILLDYNNKYPHLFRLILQKSNVGSEINLIETISACKGQYIAYLEGDDYWTDECKLQKQVDFLDSNPDFGMVHTRANIIDENDNLLSVSLNNQPAGDVFEYLIFKSSFIISCTAVCRVDIIKKLFERFNDISLNYILDYYFWLYIALFSKIHFLNDVTSAYRSHKDGISKNKYFFAKKMPYIITDIISERFKMSKIKKIKLSKRFKFGIKYSGAILSRGMKIKDKIMRLNFYFIRFYLLPTLLISLLLKMYSYTKRITHFKIVF